MNNQDKLKLIKQLCSQPHKKNSRTAQEVLFILDHPHVPLEEMNLPRRLRIQP